MNEQTKTILLVEDDTATLEFMSDVLTTTKCSFEIAKNGDEALQKLTSTQYALILMDIHLPGKDGIEVTKHIRGNPGPNQKTPIFALTASVLEKEQDAVKSAGVTDLIQKPIDVKSLREKIQGIIGNS